MLKRLAFRPRIDKRVHAHGLRDTHAAQLRAEGVDIDIISRKSEEALARSRHRRHSQGRDQGLRIKFIAFSGGAAPEHATAGMNLVSTRREAGTIQSDVMYGSEKLQGGSDRFRNQHRLSAVASWVENERSPGGRKNGILTAPCGGLPQLS